MNQLYMQIASAPSNPVQKYQLFVVIHNLHINYESNPNHFKVVGENSLEMNMRKRGVNIIHGGKNALRFTPHFSINSQEINLIMQVLREVITSYRL